LNGVLIEDLLQLRQVVQGAGLEPIL
jgi:hypothetical protein